MAEFVEGNELNIALEDVIKTAKKEIILMSPFIKLHVRIKDLLKHQGQDPNITIIVVFGKNEGHITESLGKEDFEFLKNMVNIEIKYQPRLHAKYFANEKLSLLTSMNLHSHSQNNNIEFGIITLNTFSEKIKNRIVGNSIDADAFNYFQDVIEDSETFFLKETRGHKTSKLPFTKENYSHSEITIDKLTELYNVVQEDKFQKGYCIRKGTEIPFDINKPMSWTGFQEWRKDGADKKSKEKYCHFSGELSNGETSITTPVLKKYYKKTMGSN